MKLVPEEDRRAVWDLMRRRQAIPVVERDSFVRMRSGQYKGDIAYVPLAANSTLPPMTHEDHRPLADHDIVKDDLLVLWLVPRLDLDFTTKPKPLLSDYQVRAAKRRRIEGKGKADVVKRPEATPFDPKNVQDCLRRQQLVDDPEYALVEESEGKWTFLGRTFEHGFERLHVFGIHAVKPILRPSPEEVAPYIGVSQTAIRVTNGAYTRVGDRVRTKKNSTGTIISSSTSTFTVRLDWDTDGKALEEVEAGDFERLFEMGEWVTIRLGPEAGRSGAVGAIDGPYLTVANRDVRQMVRIVYPMQ